MSRTTRFSGAFAVAAIAWVVCLAPSAAGAAEASSACAQAVPPDDSGATTEAKLSLDTEETGADHLEFKFGRERRPQDDAFIFKSDGVLPPRNTTLITSISSLRNSDGRLLRGVDASAVVISRHAVKVTV